MKRQLPVDRGWAWVICFAGFLVHTLLGSSGQVNTIMLEQLIEKYHTSITTISWMFTCGILAFSVFSMLSANFFLPRFGEQRCVMFGGLVSAMSSVGQGLSPHVAGVIILEGVRGMGHGILFVPAMCLIRQYFKKLRSTASVIVFCGGCVAAIVAPFIIREVSREYGITGTYLLLAAVETHHCVAGLLLRPISAYSSTLETRDNEELKVVGETRENKTSNEDAPKQAQSISNGAAKTVPDPDQEVSEKLIDNTLHVVDTVRRYKPYSRGLSVDSTGSDVSVRYRHKTGFGSVLTLTSEHGAACEMMYDKEDQEDARSPGEAQVAAEVSRIRKFYNEASLNLWATRLSLVAIMPGTVHVYIAIYTPMILHSKGASLDELTVLLTILGILDLVSRLGMGFLADTHILSATLMFSFSQIFIGILCQFVDVFNTFETLIVYVILLGSVIGARMSLLPLVVMEVVGVEKMPQAFSIISMVATITAAGINPLFGAITEATGSFMVALHIVGACFCIGAVMWLVVPRIVQLDIKKGRRT